MPGILELTPLPLHPLQDFSTDSCLNMLVKNLSENFKNVWPRWPKKYTKSDKNVKTKTAYCFENLRELNLLTYFDWTF